jgi:hypothetical protein
MGKSFPDTRLAVNLVPQASRTGCSFIHSFIYKYSSVHSNREAAVTRVGVPASWSARLPEETQ